LSAEASARTLRVHSFVHELVATGVDPQMRLRAPLAAALAALITVAPGLALPALASSVTPAATETSLDAIAASPKVVIVVGATEGTTPAYRADADKIYAEAIKYTPNVIKIYSPNATWAKVKAAAQGASIFVYLGHGYGFPSPYRPALSPDVQDGMGLNAIGGVNDSDKKYYGESLIASDIRFAKNAVVILNHLCYSAGSSETGYAEPTVAVAKERVDNFASGWIRAGARMVMADSWTAAPVAAVKAIFTTNQTIGSMWNNLPSKQGHQIPFVPTRNPQFEGRLDPDTLTTGFHRSIVGALGMTTNDVVAGASAATTNPVPDDQSPQLWSLDGSTALTPNFDGLADTLNLLERFSETVSWSASIRNAGGDVVRTQTGSGHQAGITWDVLVNGGLAPEGAYAWDLHATDAAGNPPLDTSGAFTVAYEDTPDTSVLSFKPTTPAVTTSPTVSYALKFGGAVSGLASDDFTLTGTATACVIGTLTGAAADYYLTVSGCTSGTVILTLGSATVADAATQVGPASSISAPAVTIDTSAPTAVAPRPILRTGVALAGSSTTQALPVNLSWSGTDIGTGIASYEVARSYDGGAYVTIAAATPATAMNLTMSPGHAYRLRVRARDKAGNVGAWATASTWPASLTQETSTSLAYAGTWLPAKNAAYSGGTVKFAGQPGSSVSLAFSGRAIAWVTTLRPTGGVVEVYVDGVLEDRSDTRADTTTYRRVAFSKNWTTVGSHTIKLVVVGTPGRPVADLDAFEIIR
jgi:hypothetical protein